MKGFRSWKVILSLFFAAILALATIAFAYFPTKILHTLHHRQLVAHGMQIKQLWVDGCRIHYAEGGQGRQTVILLHGFRSSASYWLPYLDHLLQRYHVVALDLPGFGSSQRRQGQRFDLRSQGHGVSSFLKAKEIDECCLIGASMGAGVALACAGELPDRIKAVVLINPLAVQPPQVSEVEQALERGENILVPKDEAGFVKMQELVYGAPLQLNRMIEKLILNALAQDRDYFLQVFEQLVQGESLEPILPQLALPVLLIQAEQDRVVDPSSARYMAELLPHVELAWIPGAAHTLRGAHRQCALQLIDQFLPSHEQ